MTGGLVTLATLGFSGYTPPVILEKVAIQADRIVVAQATGPVDNSRQEFLVTRRIDAVALPGETITVFYPKTIATAPIDGDRLWIRPKWNRGTKTVLFLDKHPEGFVIANYGSAWSRVADAVKPPTVLCKYERIGPGIKVGPELRSKSKNARLALQDLIAEIKRLRFHPQGESRPQTSHSGAAPPSSAQTP